MSVVYNTTNVPRSEWDKLHPALKGIVDTLAPDEIAEWDGEKVVRSFIDYQAIAEANAYAAAAQDATTAPYAQPATTAPMQPVEPAVGPAPVVEPEPEYEFTDPDAARAAMEGNVALMQEVADAVASGDPFRIAQANAAMAGVYTPLPPTEAENAAREAIAFGPAAAIEEARIYGEYAPARERISEIERLAQLVFPTHNYEELLPFASLAPNTFLADLRRAGRTVESEALLRALFPRATDDDVDAMFAAPVVDLTSSDRESLRVVRTKAPTFEAPRPIAEGDIVLEGAALFDRGTLLANLEAQGFKGGPITLETDDGRRIIAELRPDLSVWYEGREQGALDDRLEFEVRSFEWGDVSGSLVAMFGDVAVTEGQMLTWMGTNGMLRKLVNMPATLVGQEDMFDQADIQEKLDWLAGKGIGAGKYLQRYGPPDIYGPISWANVGNPGWWLTKAPRTTGASLMMMAPTIAALYATGGLSAPVTLGLFAKTIMTYLGIAGLGTMVESSLEAGQFFDDMIAEGMPIEEAKKLADQLFWRDMQNVVTEFPQLAMLFMPGGLLPKIAARGLVKVVVRGGKMVASTLTEAGQELRQLQNNKNLKGEPFEWDAEALETGVMAGIAGLTIAGMADIWTNIRGRTLENVSPETREKFKADVAELQAQGVEPEMAQVQAFDNLTQAEPKAVEDAMETVKQEGLLEEIKPTADVVENYLIDRERAKIPPPPRTVEEVLAEKQPWEMTAEEWFTAFEETRADFTGGQAKGIGGMGTATSEAGLGARASAIQQRQQFLKMGLGDTVIEGQQIPARHFQVIEEALRQGKPVPAEVLADYPDLAVPTEAVRQEAGAPEAGVQAKPEPETPQQRIERLRLGLEGTETENMQTALSNIEEGLAQVPETQTTTTEYYDDLLTALEKGEITAEEATVKAQHVLMEQVARAYQTKASTLVETKAKLVKYIRGNLPLFGKRQQGAMLTAVKNVKTERGMNKVIAQVNEYAEVNAQKVLKAKIERDLARLIPEKAGGIPRGKTTVAAERILEPLRANLKADRAAVLGQIAANQQAFNDGKMLLDEMIVANDTLQYAGIEGMTSTELQNVLDYVRDVRKTGRSQGLEEAAAFRAKIDDRGRGFAGDITKGKGVRDVTPGQRDVANTSILRKFAQHQMDLRVMVQEISGRKGVEAYAGRMNKWAENVPQASRIMDGLIRQHMGEVHQAAADIFGGTKRVFFFRQSDISAKLNEITDTEVEIHFRNKNGVMTHLKMTRGEMLNYFNWMKDPTLERSFREGNGWTDEVFEFIAAEVTPQEVAWADWIMDFYQRYGKADIAPVYEKTFRVPWPGNPHYSPVFRDGDSVKFPDTPAPVLMMRENVQYASTHNKHLAPRVGSHAALDARDINAVLVDHISEMDHFIAWTDPIAEWRAVLRNPDVRQAILQEHGQDILTHLNNYVNWMAKGGVEAVKMNHYLDLLRRNSTRAMLGIKPAVALKQPFSVFYYMSQMPIGDFFTGVADFWSNPIANYRKLIALSPTLAKRFGTGFERDIHVTMQTSPVQKIAGEGNLKDLMMIPIQTMDKFAVVQGSWAVYRSQKMKGKTDEEAILQAEIVTDETQPSFNIWSMSPFQNGGSFYKLMTMFMNQPATYWRTGYISAKTIKTGEGSRAKAAFSLALAWVVLPMLFQYGADAFQWKKEHQIRAGVFGPLNYLLIAGGVFSSLIDNMLGEGFDWQVSPATSFYDSFKFALMKVLRIKNDWSNPMESVDTNDVWAMIEHMAKGVGYLTGLPTPWLVQAERGLREGEPKEIIFSRWSMRPPKKSDHQKADHAVSGLGDWTIDEDGIVELKKGSPIIQDMNWLDTILNGIYKDVLPGDVKGDSIIKSHAQQRTDQVAYESKPNVKLKDLLDGAPLDQWLNLWEAYSTAPDADTERDMREDWGMADIRKGNLTTDQKLLLREYEAAEDKEAFLKEHEDALNVNPRTEWLKNNPKENARLAIWGEAKPMSIEAYDLALKMIEDLGIPEGAWKMVLPREKEAEFLINYWNSGEEYGYGSAEAQLALLNAGDEGKAYLKAQNPDGKYEVDTPRATLELQVKNREIRVLWEGMNAQEKKAWLEEEGYAAVANATRLRAYKDDLVRIEAYNNEWSDEDAELAVERSNLVAQYGGGSSEVVKWDMDNPDVWAKGRILESEGGFGWSTHIDEDGQLPDERVLDINVQWGQQDDEYEALTTDEDRANMLAGDEDYAIARRQREGYRAGISDESIDAFVEWKMKPEWGKWRDRYLLENDALYQELIGKGLKVPFDEGYTVPPLEFDLIKERHFDLFKEYEGVGDPKSEFFINEFVTEDGTILTGSDAREAKRVQLLADNSEGEQNFMDDRLRYNAYDKGLTDPGIVEEYATYYAPDGPQQQAGYEDDWYIIEHPEFYAAMLNLPESKQPWAERDFTKTPTRAVGDLLAQYDALEDSDQREALRRLNPTLDAYKVIVDGYDPVTGNTWLLTPLENIFADPLAIDPDTGEPLDIGQVKFDYEAELAFEALKRTLGSLLDVKQQEFIDEARVRGIAGATAYFQQQIDPMAREDRAKEKLYKSYGDFESPNYIENATDRATKREEMLNKPENAAWAVYRREQDAIAAGIDVTKYLAYYDLPMAGDERERMLRDDRAFYDSMVAAGKFKPKPESWFESIKPVRYDEIYNEWQSDFEAHAAKVGNAKGKYLVDNPTFALAYYEREAYGEGVADAVVPDYAQWYSNQYKTNPQYSDPPTRDRRWGDDWFLIENPAFYQEQRASGRFSVDRDFSKIPTRAVAALYDERLAMTKLNKKGEVVADVSGRKAFEARKPTLDMFMNILSGNKLEPGTSSVNLANVLMLAGRSYLPEIKPKFHEKREPLPEAPRFRGINEAEGRQLLARFFPDIDDEIEGGQLAVAMRDLGRETAENAFIAIGISNPQTYIENIVEAPAATDDISVLLGEMNYAKSIHLDIVQHGWIGDREAKAVGGLAWNMSIVLQKDIIMRAIETGEDVEKALELVTWMQSLHQAWLDVDEGRWKNDSWNQRWVDYYQKLIDVLNRG